MLTKLCKCGKQIPINKKQCDDCSSKYQKQYDRYSRRNYDVYHDKRWSKLTEQCKSRANGIDLYHYYKYRKIIAGTLAHHIVEVNEDRAKAFDLDNLFWLSDKSHKEIHALYNKGLDSRQGVQSLLKKLQAGGML